MCFFAFPTVPNNNKDLFFLILPNPEERSSSKVPVLNSAEKSLLEGLDHSRAGEMKKDLGLKFEKLGK